MKKVLVTGATGFIGTVLIRRLNEAGITVVAGMREPVEGIWDQALKIDFGTDQISGDILQGIDTVFHLAGKAHALSEIAQDEDEYFSINTEGTRSLLNAAQSAGVEAFVYFSSVKAAGDTDGLMDETILHRPDTPYGSSKREAERLVLDGGFVAHPVVIRPAMVYGKTTRGNLVKMIRSVQKGHFPPFPHTHNKRSMVHVDDVVQAAMLAAEKSEAAGEVYIVTDGNGYSTQQIYKWICESLKKPVPSWHVPLFALTLMAKVGDVIGRFRGRRFPFDTDALQKLVGSAFYSSDKIERELGFKPTKDLRSALTEIVEFSDFQSP